MKSRLDVSEKKRKMQEKLDVWNDKFMSFFERMAILRQEPEMKSEISQSIVADVNTGGLYWFQVVLSALIATLGLLQDSVAVVIGAMLIAPLLVPLQGLSFAITEGKPGLFWKSCRLLVFSTLVSVVVAMGVVYVVPLNEETGEILARVSPNILDLFIAAFSAVLALLALVYRKLSSSVAGVAMAASLMPPLAVIGIQIGFGNLDKAMGASLLYVTNIVAIILVGVVMFFLYGFNPHRQKTYGVLSQALFLVIVAVGLSFPLMTSVKIEQAKVNFYAEVKDIMTEALSEEIPAGVISELMVEKEGEVVRVDVDLRLPEGVRLFEGDLDGFNKLVADKLGVEVDMNIDIIRVAQISKIEDVENVVRDNLSKGISDLFAENVDGGVVLDVDIVGNESLWRVRLLYFLKGNVDKDKFEAIVRDEFVDGNFEFEWVALDEAQERSENDKKVASFELEFEDYLEANLEEGWFVSLIEARVLQDELGAEVYDVLLSLSLPGEDYIEGNEDVERFVQSRINQFQRLKAGEGVTLSVVYDITYREKGVRVNFFQ